MSPINWQFLIILAVSTVGNLILATPIDNGVEGDPEIECGANSISVNFNTRNEFTGHVYVKGRYAEQGCKSDEGGRKVAGIKLAFDQCGTQRTRSLNPKGVTVTNTVVITFHPQFLTKVDRAYTVQCFYMEADKTVSQDLEVSEITTAFQTQTVPMPICQYEILDGGPDGQPVKFASIGQQVYHKWSCTTETTDIFCAIVHSCFVDDGAGNRQQLLDENGCALDKFLLPNLEYPSDLMAGQQAMVFKYADKPALFFQCQVTISIKEPSQQCPRPQCGEPGGAGSLPGSKPPPSGPVAPSSVSSAPPRGLPPSPAPQAPASTPRSLVAPLANRGLFLAPLQAIRPNSAIAGSTRGTRPPLGSSPSPLNAGRPPAPPPSQLAPASSPRPSPPSAPSTPIIRLVTRPPPPQLGTPSIPTPSTTRPPAPPAPALPAPAPVPAPAPSTSVPPPRAPVISLPPATLPPRPPTTVRPAESLNPDQLNFGAGQSGPDNGGFDFPERRRRARRSPIDSETVAGVWDVRAQPITALDIDHIGENTLDGSVPQKGSSEGVCLSPMALGLFLSFVIAFSIFTAMIVVLHCLRRTSK